MSTTSRYLAVFTSDKTGPRWRAWYAMTDEERRTTDEIGLAAIAAWDEAHRDVIVYPGGPLGPTKRITPETGAEGVTDVVNDLTVFMVVRAESHEAAVRLFEGHPHMTIFPCDGVEVMPLLGA